MDRADRVISVLLCYNTISGKNALYIWLTEVKNEAVHTVHQEPEPAFKICPYWISCHATLPQKKGEGHAFASCLEVCNIYIYAEVKSALHWEASSTNIACRCSQCIEMMPCSGVDAAFDTCLLGYLSPHCPVPKECTANVPM